MCSSDLYRPVGSAVGSSWSKNHWSEGPSTRSHISPPIQCLPFVVLSHPRQFARTHTQLHYQMVVQVTLVRVLQVMGLVVLLTRKRLNVGSLRTLSGGAFLMDSVTLMRPRTRLNKIRMYKTACMSLRAAPLHCRAFRIVHSRPR